MAKPKQKIVATAENVTAEAITPIRPSWKDMIASYPGEAIKSADFYPMVSDEWVKNVKKDPDSWSNTCAGRMSYALNHSGIELDKAPKGGSFKGVDDKNYWFRVLDLKKYLKSRFKAGDIEYTLKPLPLNLTQETFNQRVKDVKTKILDKINGKHGIVVFEVSGWADATNHFTLWDGSNLVYVGPHGDHNDQGSAEYYFWLIRSITDSKGNITKIIQTTKVIFWELK